MAAMAFLFASTNLVVELGILLALLMGWQFTLAEFTGGPLMIAFMVLLFKAFLTPRIVEAARHVCFQRRTEERRGNIGAFSARNWTKFWTLPLNGTGGVTFHIACNGACTSNDGVLDVQSGNVVLNLSAPTSGSYDGILFY